MSDIQEYDYTTDYDVGIHSGVPGLAMDSRFVEAFERAVAIDAYIKVFESVRPLRHSDFRMRFMGDDTIVFISFRARNTMRAYSEYAKRALIEAGQPRARDVICSACQAES